MKRLSPLFLVLILTVSGCGDNLENPAPSVVLPPPAAVKALSVDQSTVDFQWSAPSGTADSTIAGYVAQVGGRTDTLSRSTTSILVDSLLPGTVNFAVSLLKTDGRRSDPATLRWAPAARFDSAYEVHERTTFVSTDPDGFDVGTSTTNPSAMVIDLNDPMVQQTLDLFFNGDTVETHQSLSMWSANLLLGPFNATLFSTRTDASPTLDFPLGAFPAEDTFVKDSVTVVDNTIYYAKVIGDPQQVNYARIHVHIKAGTFPPNRIIEVRVSLQRVPGLQFALGAQPDPRKMFGFRDFLFYYHS